MRLSFSKYEGTGNDFVMIDGIHQEVPELTAEKISYLCDRKFGIGADGLIVLRKSDNSDFYLDYYNADGSQSFCGNGARSSVMFARQIGIIEEESCFEAIDGIHRAEIQGAEVALEMLAVHSMEQLDKNHFVLDTGSPHYISFRNNLKDVDVVGEGARIRYSAPYQEAGINVNFVELLGPKDLMVYTYERGVEDETLSCGTGVTAVALAYARKNGLSGEMEIALTTKGGYLKVRFVKEGESFDPIYLIGPAKFVFDGRIEL
ncbi:MAG: diaminopimelate epimerase [Bacteroidetes bacterium]|nr:MAG: diaminopimelate epimerase [Bacteroidota bacterium]